MHQRAFSVPENLSIETQAARLDEARSTEYKPASDELPFKVPSSLLRVLDRDLKAAGIPKRDDRGRIFDVHALRHTFGTHLSMAGVPLRTAQAALWHSSPVLTANIYTDPRLLDIHGAVESPPALTSTGVTHHGSGKQRATGTADDRPSKLAPLLAPKTYNRVQTESFPVHAGNPAESNPDRQTDLENDAKPTKEARILTEKDSGLKSGRQDTVRTFWLRIRRLASRDYAVNARRCVTVNLGPKWFESPSAPRGGLDPNRGGVDPGTFRTGRLRRSPQVVLFKWNSVSDEIRAESES